MEANDEIFKLSSYDFDLPVERIAPFPLAERRMSKLLVLDRSNGGLTDAAFANIGKFLKPGDLLVFNDTRVIKARLFAKRETGGRVEVFLVRPHELRGDSYELHTGTWDVLLSPARSLKIGQYLKIPDGLVKIIDRKDGGIFTVEIEPSDGKLDTDGYLERYGEVPVPPYVQRRRTLSDCAGKKYDDDSRYQTVYAKNSGSVAAPTAGFHFDKDCLGELGKMGVKTAFVTLHVGLGTFKPVKVDDVREHKMEPEWFYLPPETQTEVDAARKEKRRVIAVGTTSVRVLESAYRTENTIRSGWTDLFIYPGFDFRAIDAMITNFHLPQSTLLLLVSALAGRENIKKAYEHAVKGDYRFFSYGDVMFIV